MAPACIKKIIETLKQGQICFNYDNPATFISSQWQKGSKPSIFYLLYRWGIALFFFITFVLSIVDLNTPNATPSYRAKWLIYLTHWGYTICTLQSLIGVIMVTIFVVASYMKTTTLKFYKVYWVTNIIATDLAFTITLIYWSMLYKGQTLQAMNFFVHAGNSIFMMIDLFVVAHPVRLLHCCYPALFGLCYVIFSAIYYAAGGTNREGQTYIYYILNWNNPGPTVGMCTGVLLLITVLHIITWMLYYLRRWIHSKYFGNEERNDSEISFVNT